MEPSRGAYRLVMGLWRRGKHLNRLASRPVLAPVLRPCFDAKSNHAVIIPVQEAVRGTESVLLTYPLLVSLIEQASGRVILKECLCRKGEGCRNHPHQIGCLFLGEGALAVADHMGIPVPTAQALAHARRAMEAGLVPLIVHSSFDAWLLGIPYRSALAICFCCDCCCSVRHGLRLGPPSFWDTVQRLPGLSLSVGPECTACRLCLEACHVNALSVERGYVRIDDGICNGCGRCASMCPEGAITLHAAEEQETLGELLAAFEARTEFRS